MAVFNPTNNPIEKGARLHTNAVRVCQFDGQEVFGMSATFAFHQDRPGLPLFQQSDWLRPRLPWPVTRGAFFAHRFVHLRHPRGGVPLRSL